MVHDITMTITFRLSDQTVLDGMTTAIESQAIRYWARYLDVQRDDDRNVTQFTVCDIEEDPSDPDTERYVVTTDVFVEGMRRILSREVPVADYIYHYIERAVRQDDAGDIDAEASDCIVQAGCIGEVIYG